MSVKFIKSIRLSTHARIIYLQLRKFLATLTTTAGLESIYTDAGQDGKIFDATKYHPDEAVIAILDVACTKLGISREVALEEFGKFITPGVMKTFKASIRPEWKSLDLLEHVESTIHRTVRTANPGSKPPKLIIQRIRHDEVQIDYTSSRQMISLGTGIIKQIGEYYSEELSIIRTSISGGTRLNIRKR